MYIIIYICRARGIEYEAAARHTDRAVSHTYISIGYRIGVYVIETEVASDDVYLISLCLYLFFSIVYYILLRRGEGVDGGYNKIEKNIHDIIFVYTVMHGTSSCCSLRTEKKKKNKTSVPLYGHE